MRVGPSPALLRGGPRWGAAEAAGQSVSWRHGAWARLGGVLVLVGLLADRSVQAQSQGLGTLTGTVVDGTTKAALADVVVTASSPQLPGKQVAVTDGTGVYRIPQLPPGTYSLRFEKETYEPAFRRPIVLDADATLRLNIQLSPPSSGHPTVSDGGTSPLIDVATAQTGLTLTGSFSQSIPISPASAGNGGIRSFSGLALVAPQVGRDLFGVSMTGATSPENSYLVDGLSFSDTGFGVNNRNSVIPGAGGTAGSDFSVEFIDQLQAITGGYMPEYGRTTGGVLSLTTKSGGNEFHGSVFATWTPGFLAQTGQAVGNAGSIFASSTKLSNAFDVGFTLGGYILKDRLWFFVGFNPSQYRTETTRTISPFDANGNEVLGAQPVVSQNYFGTQTDYSYLAKLTYLINPDNRLSLTVAGMPDSYSAPYALGPNGDLSSSSFAGNDNTLDVVLRWNSSFLDKRLLLDVTLGWHHQSNNLTALDGTSFGQGGDAAIPAVIQAGPFNLNQFPEDPGFSGPQLAAVCSSPGGDSKCAVSGYTQGGPTTPLRSVTEDRLQAKAVLSYFLSALGHQTWKGGVDVESIRYENKIGYAGSDLYQNLSASPPSVPGLYVDQRAFGSINSPDNAAYAAFQDNQPTALLPGVFVQDSWNILDKVTVNLGVRYDAEYMYGQNGELALALNGQWSPRIGVLWDPTYQGKSKIYASYGLYYEAVPLDLADRSLLGNETIFAGHGLCANPAVTHTLCPSTPSTLVGGAFGPNQYWGSLGADKILIDPNVGPQQTDEFQLGAEYELFPNTRLGVNYTHRGMSRLLEDFSNNGGTTLVLGNPGQASAGNFVTPARIYNGYTFSLTKAFANHWQAQVSYTFQTLNGNVDGLYTPNQGQLDPNINATYDLPIFLVNAFGPLAADQQSRIKAYGSYQLIFTPTVGLTVGAAYNGVSGSAISTLAGYPGYGGDIIFIIPRGSYGRLPWVNELDLHITLDVSFGQDLRLQLGVDVFNVIGSQQVTAVDQSWVHPATLYAAPIPNGTVADLQHITNPFSGFYPTSGPNSILNPNYGHATAYQAPRNVRLLARFIF
jgi:hypothetical protein